MGVRFRYTSRTFKNQLIDVTINDSDYAGSEQTFELQEGGLEKNYEGQPGLSPFDQRIIPCTLTLRILDTGTIVETLFEDIATSKEGRFTVQVYINSVLDFSGVVAREQGDLIDGYREFWDLVAFCGLALLRNYKYDYQIADPIYAYPDRMTNHVIEILKKIKGVSDLYGDTDDFLATYLGYIHSEHPMSSDPFFHTGHGNFFWNVKNGFLEYENCYQVLDSILNDWTARIFQQNGIYIIEDITTKEDKYNNYFVYKKDKTYSTTKPRGATYTISGTNLDNSNAPRGAWGYMPGLKSLTQYLDTDEISLNLLSGIKISGTENTDFAETNLFYISAASSLKVIGRLYFFCQFLDTWDDGTYPLRQNWYYKFQIRVKIDDVYINTTIKRKGNKLVNPVTNTFWSSSPTNYITFYVPVFPEWKIHEEEFVWEIYPVQLLFESIAIPKAGDLSIEIIYDKIYEVDSFGDEGDNQVINMAWEVTQESKIIISDDAGDLEKGSVSIPFFTLIDEDNSYAIEKTHRTGDIITENMQQLYVTDGSLFSGQPVWQKSSLGTWDHESDIGGLSTTKEKQIARMIGKIQHYSIKTYAGTIYDKGDFIWFDNLIEYRGYTYAALSLTVNYLLDIIYGKWFALARDDSFSEDTPDPAEERRKVKTRDIPISPENIGLPDNIGDPYTIAPFIKEFTLSNETTIDTSLWSGNFPWPDSATDEQWNGYCDFFIVNTKHSYKSGTLTQNTWQKSGDIITLDRPRSGKCMFRIWNLFNVTQVT